MFILLQPIPPSQIHAFYGSGTPSDTNNEQFKSTKAQSDYYAFLTAEPEAKAPQSFENAQAAFYDDSAVEEAGTNKLGHPIPGYSGVNRRVQADNVFGMTYAEARRMAGESQGKITNEKKDTLKETSRWIPEHKRM